MKIKIIISAIILSMAFTQCASEEVLKTEVETSEAELVKKDNTEWAVINANLERNSTPHIRINVIFEKPGGPWFVRQVVQAFRPETTDCFDRGHDASSPLDASSEMWFPVGCEQLKIPCVISTTNLTIGKVIPITFDMEANWNVQLDIIEDPGMENHNILLWDRTNGISYSMDINKTPRINLKKGVNEGNFFLVFRGEFE